MRLAYNFPPIGKSGLVEALKINACRFYTYLSRPHPQLRENLRRLKRGSEPYLNVLPDIAVCGEVIKAKVESLTDIIDGIEDAMPDD